ncbi:hypothetical protein TNCV_2632701 [Trichonephila clavipes]|nr:hypothetical protein TNCV_2632701 [Trichonephila clavipes]
MLSIGDRSGDHAYQGNNQIPYVSRKVRTQHAVLHYLAGRWPLTTGSERWGTTTGRKVSEMYQSAFKLPSIKLDMYLLRT